MEYTDILFHWNASPVLFNLGPLTVRWYGLLFAAAFLIGLQIMRWIYRHEQRNPDELDSLFLYILVGTVAGARLGHVLFYDPAHYLANPLEVVMVWKGGLASHGGTVGIIVAIMLYSRKQGHPGWLWILDRFCMTAALGGALIRIGNFFNSEIIGTPVNGGVVFDRFDSLPRHPVQLYESFSYLTIFVITLVVYKRYGQTMKDGRLFGLFLAILFGSRFMLEFFKTRQADYATTMDISVGQWLSIPFVFLGIALMLKRHSNTQK